MTGENCKVCNSNNLKPKWDSNSGLGWVCCDNCGNISKPIPLSEGREKIIEQWNNEQLNSIVKN